jgi:hypothetical protein
MLRRRGTCRRPSARSASASPTPWQRSPTPPGRRLPPGNLPSSALGDGPSQRPTTPAVSACPLGEASERLVERPAGGREETSGLGEEAQGVGAGGGADSLASGLMQTSKVHARDLAGVPQRWGRSPRPESAPARSRSPPSRDLAAQMTSPTAAAQRHPSPENSRYPCTDRSARSTPEVRSWGQSVTSPVGAAAHPGAMPVTSEYHESRQRSSVPIQETHSRRKPSDKTGAGTQQSSTATAAVGSPGSWGQDAWGTPTKTSGALDGMASFAAKEALLTQHEDRGRLLKTCKGFQELGFRPKNFEELCEEDSLEDKLPRFDMEVHGTQTKS